MSPESSEFWKSIFEIVGVVLLGATFLAGLGFWYFGGKVSEFQKERLRTFDKDLTTAKGELSIQEQRAADAEKQLELVKQSTSNAEKDVARANQHAGEANEKAAEASIAAEELRQKNLETEKILGQETDKRLELEKSIAPRGFVIKVTGSPNSNFEELKPFAGTHVIFEVLTDAEARRAANEVGNLVGFAGWKVVSVNSNPDLWMGFFDGVSIVTPERFPEPMPGQVGPKILATREKTRKAAESLALWLIGNGWKASVRNNIPDVGEIPDDTIKIFIGFKPNPFFDPDWVKEMEKQYEQMLKQQMKMREDLENRFPQPPNKD
jgi:hypothetical protein